MELHGSSRESYTEGEGVERVRESAVPPPQFPHPLGKALSDLQERKSLRVKGEKSYGPTRSIGPALEGSSDVPVTTEELWATLKCCP